MLFLLSELSSQAGNINLYFVTKHLPPGLHYMTGENADIRVAIPNEPVQVVETGTGNIIAIIDSMGFIRAILNSRNQIVQIIQRRHNNISLMQNHHFRLYRIEFNIRRSALPPAHQNK